MADVPGAVTDLSLVFIDALERLRADDVALFGEAALSLKHGRLALAIERGRVVRVDRS